MNEKTDLRIVKTKKDIIWYFIKINETKKFW